MPVAAASRQWPKPSSPIGWKIRLFPTKFPCVPQERIVQPYAACRITDRCCLLSSCLPFTSGTASRIRRSFWSVGLSGTMPETSRFIVFCMSKAPFCVKRYVALKRPDGGSSAVRARIPQFLHFRSSLPHHVMRGYAKADWQRKSRRCHYLAFAS